MATRMQQRRGTASQWTSANPTLAEGEIGWESDTNKFKIGDGVNNWALLSYFIDENSIGGSLDGYATEAYVDDAIAEIPVVDLTGYATETYVGNQIANLVDSAPATLDTLNELAAALGDDANFATTVTNAIAGKQDIVSGVSSTEIGYLDGVTSAIQTQINGKANTSHTHAISDVINLSTALDGKANLSGASFTGNISTTGTVSGTAAAGTNTTAATGVGYMGIPQSLQPMNISITLSAGDAGDVIYSSATRNVTIPAGLPVGTTFVFVSGPSVTTTIAINTDTMILANTTTTGSRTLAANGMATAVKVLNNTWYISGNGLT